MAKCDEERASQTRPVNGPKPTTANLAEVVSGVPTSGLSAITRQADSESGSATFPLGEPDARSAVPSPTPPR